MGDLMTAKKTSTKKTEEVPDDSLLISVDVTFTVPFKQNEQHNRKPLDVLGIDATDLSDDAIAGLVDEKAAELLETADLNVTNARIS
jgi:hypothetical protein